MSFHRPGSDGRRGAQTGDGSVVLARDGGWGRLGLRRLCRCLRHARDTERGGRLARLGHDGRDELAGKRIAFVEIDQTLTGQSALLVLLHDPAPCLVVGVAMGIHVKGQFGEFEGEWTAVACLDGGTECRSDGQRGSDIVEGAQRGIASVGGFESGDGRLGVEGERRAALRGDRRVEAVRGVGD